MKDKKIKREKPIPERKLKAVETLRNMIKKSKTIVLASIKNLPSRQFQEIRKKLRGEVEIFVPKKSIIIRALEAEKKESLDEFKKSIREDVAIIFSNLDAFELSSMLTDNKVKAAAKAGQSAEEEIIVEEGVTDLVPGPAISELGAVGIKIAIEQGKIVI
ncbi:MAG: 50S ribosomal protein L10 [Nanoarchaeota archaeon]